MLDKLAAARDLIEPTALLTTGLPWFALVPENTGYRTTPDELRALIQAAIQQIAKDGRAVLVAHAASMTLGAQAGVVRVLATAPSDTRARRLAAAQGITAAAATAAVASYDRNRQDYFRRFHNISEELPTHYDVVVSTDVLTAEQAANVIVCAAEVRS